MKVRELVAALLEEDQELDVHYTYNYGDHWHTTVAPEARAVETAVVRFSEYHRMPKVVDDEEDSDIDRKDEVEPKDKLVVTIRSTTLR